MNFAKVRDAVLAIGLLVSCGLWIAHVRFYGELGITPGDVGIGFGQVLERCIGALLFIAVMTPMLAVLTGGIVAFVAYVTTIGRRAKPRAERLLTIEGRGLARPREGLWIVRAWIPVAVVSPLLLLAGIDEPTSVAGFAFVIVMLAAGARDRVVVVRVRVLQAWLIGVALATTAGSFVLFALEAESSAERVKDGKLVKRELFSGANTLAFRALPVVLTLDGETRCLLFLGASDGSTVLYDHKADTVERVPSGDVRVSLGGRATC